MRKSRLSLHNLAVSLVITTMFISAMTASSLAVASTEAVKKPLRAIYVEGGDYDYYSDCLSGMVQELLNKHIVNGKFRPGKAKDIWMQASHMQSGAIEFLSDGFYSAGWDPGERLRIKEEILNRITKKKDVDIIFAMGTWAGVDMATPPHNIPVMVSSVSDPHKAGIILTPTESGRANVYAIVTPDWLPRQIIFLHNLFKFKRLGITYDKSEDGRNAVGLSRLEHLSELLDFELVSCEREFDIPDLEKNVQLLLECHKELAPQVDTMYITANNALLPEYIPRLVEPFTRRNIPTFAQSSQEGVQNGILLNINQSSAISEGKFLASAFLEILSGTIPEQARHIFDGDITISLNMNTAKRIGWKPPFSLILSVDEVYIDGKKQSR